VTWSSLSHVDLDRRSVYLITSQDGGALFDLDNDEFLTLNRVAARMWTLICAGNTESEVAQFIANECDVDQELVAEDLRNVLRNAAERGIIPGCVQHRNDGPVVTSAASRPTFPWYGQDAGAPRPQPKGATVIRAFLALALFDLILSTRSLKALCRAVSKRPVGRRNLDDPDLIGRICTAVERACVWYPRRAVCLQRSAVTACLLRMFGVPAEMVVAAKVMPTLAHAWVEVDGCVVNDFPKVKNFYQTMASY
jgi:hypothetical protein